VMLWTANGRQETSRFGADVFISAPALTFDRPALGRRRPARRNDRGPASH
jgi:hypothetical protein